MEVSSSAGYASAIGLLNTRSQIQVDQVRAASDQSQQVTDLLAGGGSATPAATGGRGQIVDIQV
ncbi:hypothetical protein CHU95_07170 [Niveispirillum lacus]|uniref:Motility protein n=1 Tax=Niveispirillum lacus TaxID=1981099 RepID=A0A255Z3K2_9PROT|nr:hypothetical protein [Niveispirillum lacus]OYQ35504.1 hypothetical protein CHU95_07170 [Niveispirillum lacus]